MYVKHKRGSCHYKLYNTSMYQSFPAPSCSANRRISLFVVHPEMMCSTYYSLIVSLFIITYHWFSIESNSKQHRSFNSFIFVQADNILASISIDKNVKFLNKSNGFVTVMKPQSWFAVQTHFATNQTRTYVHHLVEIKAHNKSFW